MDLPGIIQDGAMKETINNMIHSYISKETSLIILCHECNKDNECVGAYSMAYEVDPEQKRTIKIITKCDFIESKHRRDNVRLLIESEKDIIMGSHAVCCRINGNPY